MEKIWFQNYPEGSEKFLDTSKYESILDMFDKAVREHPDRPAYINMGQVLTFRKLEEPVVHLPRICKMNLNFNVAIAWH